MDDEPIMMAGGIPITSPHVENMQLSMLIWGDSGSGKTTLAATAPGKKLFLMLDPGGELSLTNRDDIALVGMGAETGVKMMAQFRGADPYNLDKILKARPDIETVVVDSMTALAYVALQEAVARAGGATISMEQPGMNGYAWRNASIVRATVALMRICVANKRHLIVITHEGSADRNKDGVIINVTMALSENTANQLGMRFNEVWHLSDTGTERRIAIRPCRLRKPMKSRLFVSDQPEFVWHYNADAQVGEGIADWYHAWQAGGGKKLPLPVATTNKGGVKK
jgi:hypothetical protein